MNANLGVNKIGGLRNFSRALWGIPAALRMSQAIAGQPCQQIASKQSGADGLRQQSVSG
jgi:hypothetical protein